MRIKNNGGPPIKDDCQTPAYGLAPVLERMKQGLLGGWRYKNIWEPCAGEGILVRELKRNKYKVKATDIKTGTDFLNKNIKIPDVDLIITNLPFSKKYPMLERLYEIKIPFFVLVPLDTLGAAKAQNLFWKNGIEFMFLDRRINFKMPNKKWESNATLATLWLYWDGSTEVSSSYWHIDTKGRKE